MKRTVTAGAIPEDIEISRHLDGAHFNDCFSVSLPSTGQSALESYLEAVARTPAWVNRLMALRNRVVGLFGLKNLGHLGQVDTGKPVRAYRVGDRVGIFSLLYLADEEVILGDSDKHLQVRVSVSKRPNGQGDTVSVSTVVHINNLLGRAYMLFVGPVHKLIVPATLRTWGPAR